MDLILKEGSKPLVTVSGKTIIGPSDLIRQLKQIKWKDATMAARVALQYNSDKNAFDKFMLKHTKEPVSKKSVVVTLITLTTNGVYVEDDNGALTLPHTAVNENETSYAAAKRIISKSENVVNATLLKVLSNAKKVTIKYKVDDKDITDYVYISTLRKPINDGENMHFKSISELASDPTLLSYKDQLNSLPTTIHKAPVLANKELQKLGDDPDDVQDNGTGAIPKALVAGVALAALPGANAQYYDPTFNGTTGNDNSNSFIPSIVILSFFSIIALIMIIIMYFYRVVKDSEATNASNRNPAGSMYEWVNRKTDGFHPISKTNTAENAQPLSSSKPEREESYVTMLSQYNPYKEQRERDRQSYC